MRDEKDIKSEKAKSRLVFSVARISGSIGVWTDSICRCGAALFFQTVDGSFVGISNYVQVIKMMRLILQRKYTAFCGHVFHARCCYR